MPALQSPWFAPHVIVYMFAYAMLGAAAVMAVYLLWIKKKTPEEREMELCDNLVNVGLAFMTLGMLAATWLGYLCYIHFRMNRRQKVRTALVGLLICFVLLQMCWYGINYLPSAQGTSVHTYNLN